MSVDVSDTVRDGLPVVTVAGKLDWDAVGAFRAALADHLPAEAEAVLVDLAGVVSWSPSVQAAFVRVTTDCRLAGRWVGLFGLGELPSRQLAGTALAVGLNVFGTEDEARDALRAIGRGRRGRGGPATTGTTGTAVARGYRRSGYPGDERYLAATRARPAAADQRPRRPRRPR